MSANSTQVGGTHYAGSYQHWDFVSDLKLGYFEGQITKYVSRWRKKNGVQDLEKARHFLIKLLELVQTRGWVCTSGFTGWRDPSYEGRTALDAARGYCKSNGLHSRETEIICRVSTWATGTQLSYALSDLAGLIEDVDALSEAGPGYVNQDR